LDFSITPKIDIEPREVAHLIVYMHLHYNITIYKNTRRKVIAVS